MGICILLNFNRSIIKIAVFFFFCNGFKVRAQGQKHSLTVKKLVRRLTFHIWNNCILMSAPVLISSFYWCALLGKAVNGSHSWGPWSQNRRYGGTFLLLVYPGMEVLFVCLYPLFSSN